MVLIAINRIFHTILVDLIMFCDFTD